jgi:hypothetical protein
MPQGSDITDIFVFREQSFLSENDIGLRKANTNLYE